MILNEFYELVPGSAAERRTRVSLGHRHREAAKQYADDLAARSRKEAAGSAARPHLRKAL